ncbi:hypothetical protein GCM10010172_52570 [Paractinoplanes ferrugineus]
MRRKRRNRRMKTELGQSVDHFKRAASLAAQETSATVGPTLAAAVDRVQPAAAKAKGAATSGWDSALATITPLVAAATDNVRQTGKVTKSEAKKSAKQNKKNAKKLQKRANAMLGRKQGRRGSRLLGFALLGTAVGVGAAYAAKRRKAAQWDEYDPASPTAQVGGADDAAFEPVEPTAYTTPNGTVSDPAQQSPR